MSLKFTFVLFNRTLHSCLCSVIESCSILFLNYHFSLRLSHPLWIRRHWHTPPWGATGGEAVGPVGEATSDDLRWGYKPRGYIALAWSCVVHVILEWKCAAPASCRGLLSGLSLLWEGRRHVKLFAESRRLVNFLLSTLRCLESSPAWTSWQARHVKSWAKQLEANKCRQRHGQYRDAIVEAWDQKNLLNVSLCLRQKTCVLATMVVTLHGSIDFIGWFCSCW